MVNARYRDSPSGFRLDKVYSIIFIHYSTDVIPCAIAACVPYFCTATACGWAWLVFEIPNLRPGYDLLFNLEK
jgi:hypothetical protein